MTTKPQFAAHCPPLRVGKWIIAILALHLTVVVGFAALPIDYDIVYVRAPRDGDDNRINFPEVTHPITAPAGSDLVWLRPDGTEEILVPGGNGAVIDPFPSFDGEWIYYSYFPDQRESAKDRQRTGHPSRAGADIYKIHRQTREIVRLTFQEWTPNTGILDWSSNPLQADENGPYYLGYGIFNLGPCPLPDGRIVFSSSRNCFLPNQDFTAPNLQLFVMDDDGQNVELIGHMNLGSALHPTILTDGRIMFSSYEAQGLRDRRIWGLWSIWPDGSNWEPLMSAFTSPSAFHFQTQLTNGDLAVVEYYNQNDNGFGTLLAFDATPSPDQPLFGAPNPSDASNPSIQRGIWWFNDSHPSHKKPRYKSYSFSPQGLYGLTLFAHGEDNASSRTQDGDWAGKVTQPAGAPNNDVLLVWTPGPANDLNRPTNRPVYDAGIYVVSNGVPVDDPSSLVLVKNDPNFNELQPRALVPYQEIYGIEKPATLAEVQNDGSVHEALPAGTPFGLVGSSSLYRRDSAPYRGRSEFDGLDPFNTSQNGASSNWSWQGADAGLYEDSEIYAVRVLSMEPSTHVARGPGIGSGRYRGFYNFAQERLRILGEVPVRKTDTDGSPILDPDGNPDTSFLARIPADTPFTFQTIDRDGLVLNMSQTWHQLRPGEMRANCGGCHAHSQRPLSFSLTEAAKPNYVVPDLSEQTPLLSKAPDGSVTLKQHAEQAVDVEYYRDIKPILQRSCVGCHSINGPAEAQLVLDDESVVDGLENTYNRLARDSSANYGIPPVIRNKQWRQTNASRYIRKFQSRRSLLVWKLFGRRLDGWTNEDHPTESIPGDPASLPAGADANQADLDYTGTIMPPPGSGYPPLTEDEKIMFARWIDLGAPISYPTGVRAEIGWFADDLRPTLNLSAPRRGQHSTPISFIRLSAFDYYSGLDRSSLSLTSNLPINGRAPESELSDLLVEVEPYIWELNLASPITNTDSGRLTLRVNDTTGNLTEIVRTFSVDSQPSPAPLPPTNVTLALEDGPQVRITWQSPSPAPERYRVLRNNQDLAEIEQTSYVDQTPVAGETYTYSIISVGSDGQTSSAIESAAISIPSPPVGPSLNAPFTPENWPHWVIVDSGDRATPSAWSRSEVGVIQESNIHSLGLGVNRRGTMAIWGSPEAYLWEDYLMTTTMQTTDDDGIGIQFRYQDERNFYRLDLDHIQSFRRLIKVVNGEATLLAAVYGGLSIGNEFDVSVQVVGSEILVLLNGQNAFPEVIVDSDLTHGSVGLFSYANTGALFHTLTVQAPAHRGDLSPGSLDQQSFSRPIDSPLLELTQTLSGLRLNWFDPNGLWQLETRAEFSRDSDWRPALAGTAPGADGLTQISIATEHSQAFYRLVPRK